MEKSKSSCVTKQHFVKIASIISKAKKEFSNTGNVDRDMGAYDALKFVQTQFMEWFQDENDKFDAAKFNDAARGD